MKELYQQVPPWSWTLEKRLEYATQRFEKLVEIYPALAEKWLWEVESLEMKIIKRDQASHQ